MFLCSIVGAILWRSFDPAFHLGAQDDDQDVEEIELPLSATEFTPGESSITDKCAHPNLSTTNDTLVAPFEKIESIQAFTLQLPLSHDEQYARSL